MEATAFELSDPAEADLPKWVGWGPGQMPWLALCRDVREPRLAAWLSTCTPSVSRMVRFSQLEDCDRYTQFRLRQIVAWAGGEWPDWLLNCPQRVGVKRQVAMGETVYDSIAAASRATSHRRERIRLWATGGVRGWRFC